MDKLREAARQALDALEEADRYYDYDAIITALQEALAEPVKQSISEEAFNWIDANAPMFVREALANTRSSIRSTSEYSEQAEQEPVAWVDEHGLFSTINPNNNDWLPLYAAPVRTKDLTDGEKLELARSSVGKSRHWLVEAAIAADREKNK